MAGKLHHAAIGTFATGMSQTIFATTKSLRRWQNPWSNNPAMHRTHKNGDFTTSDRPNIATSSYQITKPASTTG
ncbi:MAG: hypothetical protein ACR2PR_09040 [Pseudohongiellaceae bacterium]